MIIKGASHSGRGLGAYLQGEKNERVEMWGIRGDIERGLSEALEDWRSDALVSRCSKPLYHAQLSPDRVLSPTEWQAAINIYEKEMGFENQPRAAVLHEFKGREHLHLVYSRMDEQGHAISDSWNYLHHEKAAREIERELGMEKTQGVFIEREGERPERTLSHAEIQQGERLKRDPKEIKAEVSELYQAAKGNGREFVEALRAEGYELAQGDKRGYVILDDAGGVHSLTRAAGVKVAELRETLQDYPVRDLPDITEARQMQRENLAEVKDLERQAFAADLGVGTLEREPEIKGDMEGKEADAPEMSPRDDREELNLGAGLNALADSAVEVIGGLFEGFAGGGKPPPTLEEQKAANLRNERIVAAQERRNALEFEYKKQQAQILEHDKNKERGWERER